MPVRRNNREICLPHSVLLSLILSEKLNVPSPSNSGGNLFSFKEIHYNNSSNPDTEFDKTGKKPKKQTNNRTEINTLGKI